MARTPSYAASVYHVEDYLIITIAGIHSTIKSKCDYERDLNWEMKSLPFPGFMLNFDAEGLPLRLRAELFLLVLFGDVSCLV